TSRSRPSSRRSKRCRSRIAEYREAPLTTKTPRHQEELLRASRGIPPWCLGGSRSSLCVRKEIRRVGKLRRRQVLRADADEPEGRPIDLALKKRRSGAEQHLGALRRIDELARPGAQLEVAGL